MNFSTSSKKRGERSGENSRTSSPLPVSGIRSDAGHGAGTPTPGGTWIPPKGAPRGDANRRKQPLAPALKTMSTPATRHPTTL